MNTVALSLCLREGSFCEKTSAKYFISRVFFCLVSFPQRKANHTHTHKKRFDKTQCCQPVHTNPLAPSENSPRLELFSFLQLFIPRDIFYPIERLFRSWRQASPEDRPSVSWRCLLTRPTRCLLIWTWLRALLHFSVALYSFSSFLPSLSNLPPPLPRPVFVHILCLPTLLSFLDISKS